MRSQAASMGCSCVACNDSGQATVEFAIVLAAFICIAIAYGAIWNSLKDGLFVQHALQCASHHISMVQQGAWADVLAY